MGVGSLFYGGFHLEMVLSDGISHIKVIATFISSAFYVCQIARIQLYPLMIEPVISFIKHFADYFQDFVQVHQ